MHQPGPLLASGRDADIYEYGEGLVLRRSREGRSILTEARIMEHVRAHGFPLPEVTEVSDDGTELVMERVTGPLMAQALTHRPWTFARQAAVLGDLHHRLHDIPAPEWLRAAPGKEGDRLLHLDLHPLNVIVAPSGPVVIDWPAAARGLPAVDVALTWVLLSAGAIPAGPVRAAVLERFRALFVRLFLRSFDLDEIRPHVREVVEWKVRDPHMSAAEQAGMWRLAQEIESG